jgi:6-phosphofructokinase 1
MYKKIAVLTSGGDAPGMNAAIRAVVRSGNYYGMEVFGVRNGYSGLINDEMQVMGNRDVGGIMQLGGTLLGSARCPEFETLEGRRHAITQLNQRGIEALVVIGGNGSQTGAAELNKLGFPVVGVASTIDNDLLGSDITIGVDTALNIALEAIDRLKVTASSHHRAFLVEVMGRKCGYLALMAGIAGGAEAIVIPEYETPPDAVAEQIRVAYERGKPHAIIVVAEGAKNEAETLMHYLNEHSQRLGFSVRATTLGHVQRGGAPGAYDRILATRLGAGAVDFLVQGKSGHLMGMVKGQVTPSPFSEVTGRTKSVDPALLKLAETLVR